MNDDKMKLLAGMVIENERKIMALTVILGNYVETFSTLMPPDFPKGALSSQIEQLEAQCLVSVKLHAALSKEFGL
jgi:hypothetical protein